MRLWTVNPKYLDSKGLVALWREGLLAKAVLEGKTRGYINHPQLERFRDQDLPSLYIAEYLRGVLLESQSRGYKFDTGKLPQDARDLAPIIESQGHLDYEWAHLMRKLQKRDAGLFEELSGIQDPEPHSLFRIVAGEVKSWERCI